MNFFSFVFQDWMANKRNSKGRVIAVLFRIANIGTIRKSYYYLLWPYRVFYKVIVEWVLGIEIPWNVKIGCGLRVFHGQGLVVNSDAVIGDHCTLRHCTTIGNKQLRSGGSSGSPVIGDYVDVGCNTCIIGEVHIGDHVIIGCGSVVTKDLLSHTIVAGNPAIELKVRRKAAVA
jgi:putative colanic acid biosynthesis acetyltransferase WcaB